MEFIMKNEQPLPVIDIAALAKSIPRKPSATIKKTSRKRKVLTIPALKSSKVKTKKSSKRKDIKKSASTKNTTVSKVCGKRKASAISEEESYGALPEAVKALFFNPITYSLSKTPGAFYNLTGVHNRYLFASDESNYLTFDQVMDNISKVFGDETAHLVYVMAKDVSATLNCFIPVRAVKRACTGLSLFPKAVMGLCADTVLPSLQHMFAGVSTCASQVYDTVQEKKNNVVLPSASQLKESALPVLASLPTAGAQHFSEFVGSFKGSYSTMSKMVPDMLPKFSAAVSDASSQSEEILELKRLLLQVHEELKELKALRKPSSKTPQQNISTIPTIDLID